MSAAYYSKIYDWFSDQQKGTSQSEHASTHKETSSVKSEDAFESRTSNLNFCMPPPSNRTVLSKEQNSDTNKKRNMKNKIKKIEDSIYAFILSKSSLSNRSSEIYRHILENFNKFSPSIDPSAVPKYMRWKFNLDSNLDDRDIVLHGTALKYLNILTHIYSLNLNKLWFIAYDKFLFFINNKLDFHYVFYIFF